MTDDRLTHHVPHRLSTVARATTDAVERVAFWAAVALPLVYVPLFAAGLPNPAPESVLVLVTLNVLAVLLGYRYNQQPTA